MNRFLSAIILGLSFLFAVVSCVDDTPGDNGDETITLTVSARNLMEIEASRALLPVQENAIYSLYFFIVNNDGSIASKKYVKLDSPGSSYTGKLDKAVIGSQSVYVVANAEFAENSLNATYLKDQMDRVGSVDQLESIYATYVEGLENVNRPQGHLVMSGVLKNPSTSNNTIELYHVDTRINFEISLADDAPAGADFKPTSYQIINIPRKTYLFEHAPKTDGSGNTVLVSDTNPYSTPWDAVSPTLEDDYFNSDEITYFTKSYDANKKLTSKFDFYMFENRKLAIKDTGDKYPDNYNMRDKRNLAGEWEYAHDYSTYVVIKGEYTLGGFELEDKIKDLIYGSTDVEAKIDGRQADVTYYVHLGDFGQDGDPRHTNNYFVERNCNYTFRVRVKNVVSIIVDAVKEEVTPSSKGDVSDLLDAMGEFDCHYGSMVVRFALPDKNDPSYFTDPNKCFSAHTPYSSQPDYSWVQFVPNDPQNPTKGLSYHKAKGKMIAAAKLVDYLYDIYSKDDASRYVLDGNNRYVYFTAFVDEYYPQKDVRDDAYSTFFAEGYGPDDKSVCDGMKYRGLPVDSRDPDISWKMYIGKPERSMRLFSTPYTSADGNSSYSISQVMITQRSIQTYYSIGSSDSAIGIEHTDETGLMYCFDSKTDDSTAQAAGIASTASNDGLKNTRYGMFTRGFTDTGMEAVTIDGVTYPAGTLDQLKPVKWDADDYSIESGFYVPGCIDYSKSSEELQLSRHFQKSNFNSLQRNRDLNADGVVDENEIVWFNPAINQLLMFSLASQALQSPLYDRSLKPVSDMKKGLYIHHASNTGKRMLWTEEIMSVGNLGDYDGSKNNYYRPVCRLLGTDSKDMTQTTSQPPYEYDKNTRIVKFDRLNTSILRLPIASGDFVPMTEWDPADRLSRYGFKIAAANTSTGGPDNDGQISLEDMDNGIPSPCATYSESGSDYDAAGKWRVPNLVELGIMLMLKYDGDLSISGKLTGCTKFSYAFMDSNGNIQLTPTGESVYYATNNSVLYLNCEESGGRVAMNHSYYWRKATRCVRDIQPGE